MIHIVTDSTAQLTPEEIKDNRITVVPLQVTLDGKTYRDNVDVTRAEFSRHLAEDDEFPKTSQPSVGTFVHTYESIAQPGDSIVSIHIGSVLSGTAQAAQMAADQVDVPVTVLDSGLTDRGLAFVVLQAAKLSHSMRDAKAIVGQLTDYMKQITLTCFVNSLDYFAKGGRAKRAIGFISSVIKLKLELTMPEGKLDVAHKARGEKGMQKMIKGVVDTIIADTHVKHVGLSYVDSHTDTDQIEKILREKRPDLHILNRLTSPVIMTHVGPNGFAIIYV
ncbi:DegV family protein [Schleiferilactobacillus perolens]|uniref:DegV family protein n=1 Tax=Schleiferilactobacillus perolens DSM 12744 TaxID=1423792 RepID=A0A0R1MW07_9LACO|nr:DegV family protein [Schleiferilactobacillus perolens]KRL10020.1 DegV family protein [Schleiferilactobacillus perolens DSM 12744]